MWQIAHAQGDNDEGLLRLLAGLLCASTLLVRDFVAEPRLLKFIGMQLRDQKPPGTRIAALRVSATAPFPGWVVCSS